MCRRGLRKCRHCGTWFKPQAQNAHHQRFCSEPDCRQASRKAARDKWRRRNPTYCRNRRSERWRRTRADRVLCTAIQDISHPQLLDEQAVTAGRDRLLVAISEQLRDLLAAQYRSPQDPPAPRKRSKRSRRSTNAKKGVRQSLRHLSCRFLGKLEVLHYSEQTLYNYDKYLRYFTIFCEDRGITYVDEVTKAVVLDYQEHLFRRRKSNGRALAIGTQRYLVRTVSTFFSYLSNEGLTANNPATDIEMPREETRLPKAVLTAAEAEAVIKVPDTTTLIGIRDRAILETLYSTGIRRTELCNLDVICVEFDRRLLRIDLGKGRKDRFVPIGKRALKWIEKYLVEVRPGLCRNSCLQALFLNTRCRRITPGRIGSHVHDLIDMAGIGKRGSCHLFRHAFATLLMENGCNLRYIQTMLGHSKLETTAIYTHVSLRDAREAHERYHPASS